MTNFDDLIYQLLVERDKLINEKLLDLPDGFVLCVHQAKLKEVDSVFQDNSSKFNCSIDIHVLRREEYCDAKVPKDQYTRIENPQGKQEDQ